MSAREYAIIILEKEEGFREKPYYCSEQYPTYGHGFKIGERYAPLPDKTITLEESRKRLREWVDNLIYSLSNNADTKTAFNNCNHEQQAIMVSMAYQLGMYGILKFKKFIAALNNKDFKEAAKQMQDSLAARQTPNRFARQSRVMATGSMSGIYDIDSLKLEAQG
jgi:lysozyme